MPTAADIKKFLVGTVLPPAAGALATWIVGTHVLALFPVGKSQVAYAITQIATFAITAGTTWLAQHHVLKGTYKP